MTREQKKTRDAERYAERQGKQLLRIQKDAEAVRKEGNEWHVYQKDGAMTIFRGMLADRIMVDKGALIPTKRETTFPPFPNNEPGVTCKPRQEATMQEQKPNVETVHVHPAAAPIRVRHVERPGDPASPKKTPEEKTKEQREKALAALWRAENPQGGISNDMRIVMFFDEEEYGEEIEPRVNVLTYNAWLAKGRKVKKGEHGKRVPIWVPSGSKYLDKDGNERSRFIIKGVVFFHESQTELIAK